MNNKNLALKAPLSGPVMPLNRVPLSLIHI